MLGTASAPSDSVLFLLIHWVVFSFGFEVPEWSPGPAASSFFRFQPLQSTLVLGVQHFAQFAPGLVSGEVVEGCVTSKKNPQKHEKKVEKLGVH